jgi:hypothetical protein
MNTPIEYLILKEEQVNYNYAFRCKIIHRGFTNKETYEQFLGFITSFLGFHFCTSNYFQDYCIFGDDVIIEMRNTIEGRDYFLKCRDLQYFHYFRYRWMPYVVLYDPENKLGHIANYTFNNSYFEIWPLLVILYCLEKKAYHKIIF